MSLCDDCIRGVLHEGTPTGIMKEVGGIQCYIATPEGDYEKDKAVLFLSDAFGIPLKNNQLTVDAYARNGYKTIMLDMFNGDSVPEEVIEKMEKGIGPRPDIGAWIRNHSQEVTRPIIDKVVAALKEEGISKFAATGYCFGGRYTFDLAFDNVVNVAVVTHPSLLQSPEDLERYASDSKVPLLINSCEEDVQFPIEKQAKADEILGGGKFAPGYKRTYWEGCTHGFTVRGDLSNPKIKAARDGVLVDTMNWIKSHL